MNRWGVTWLLACLALAVPAEASLVVPHDEGGVFREDGEYRIGYDGSARSILEGVAYITRHRLPATHDALTPAEQAELAKHRRHLSMTCGPSALLAKHLLAEQGIPARIVQMVTANPWPDDYEGTGHIALEVYENRRWQYYDMDYDFTARRGGPMTFWEFMRTKPRKIGIDHIAPPTKGYYRFDRLPPYYRQVMGTGLIQGTDGRVYYTKPEGHTHEEMVEIGAAFGAEHVGLPKRDFLRLLYPS